MIFLLYIPSRAKFTRGKISVKEKMDIGSTAGASTLLNELIAEHDAVFPPAELEVKRDYDYGEMLMLNHARRHLDTVIDKGDPEFMDNGIVKHQSDIVKSALLQEPKTDYS